MNTRYNKFNLSLVNYKIKYIAMPTSMQRENITFSTGKTIT